MAPDHQGSSKIIVNFYLLWAGFPDRDLARRTRFAVGRWGAGLFFADFMGFAAFNGFTGFGAGLARFGVGLAFFGAGLADFAAGFVGFCTGFVRFGAGFVGFCTGLGFACLSIRAPRRVEAALPRDFAALRTGLKIRERSTSGS